MNDNNMYYGVYGENYRPMNSFPINNFNDINERINRLERYVKRLDQRLTRIETPYNNKEQLPDNNMYIM